MDKDIALKIYVKNKILSDIKCQQLQAKNTTNMKEIYQKLIRHWLNKVQQKKIQPNSYFQRFQNRIAHEAKMQIDYDRSIMSVIIAQMLCYFTQEGIPSQNPSTLRKLNILLLIVQSLYINMFINKQDVSEIVVDLKISDKQLHLFLQSTIEPIEVRWESCIPLQMDVFWFIVAYKDVDIPLQVLLYEKTVRCDQLKDNQRIYDYYKSMKIKQSSQKEKYAKQEKENLQRTANSSKNSEQLMHDSFEVNISAISRKKFLDQSGWSISLE